MKIKSTGRQKQIKQATKLQIPPKPKKKRGSRKKLPQIKRNKALYLGRIY